MVTIWVWSRVHSYINANVWKKNEKFTSTIFKAEESEIDFNILQKYTVSTVKAEEVYSKFYRNDGIYRRIYKAPKPITTPLSSSLPWKPHVLTQNIMST
jgi:hypothetical protein